MGNSTEPNLEAEADVDQLSQWNEELDDTMAFVHDNLTRDDPKIKIPENMEDEQTTPNIDTVPIEEKDRPTTVEENQAHPTIHDSRPILQRAKRKF